MWGTMDGCLLSELGESTGRKHNGGLCHHNYCPGGLKSQMKHMEMVQIINAGWFLPSGKLLQKTMENHHF